MCAALASIGAMLGLLATVISLAHLDLTGSVNAAGIHRTVPAALTAFLAFGALLLWRPRPAYAALSAFWAVGSACYGRRPLAEIGIPTEFLYPAIGFLAWCCAYAAVGAVGFRATCAFAAAPASLFAVAAALLIGHPVSDVLAYTTNLGALGLSLRLALPGRHI